jgi:hypothetical protein
LLRIAATLSALLLLTVPAWADTATIEIAAKPVLLDPQAPDKTMVGRLEFLAGFKLDSDAAGWGSLSGMVLAPDGAALLAVSDRGDWVRIGLRHDHRGRLVGIGAGDIAPLLDEMGKPLGGKWWSDAEGLARDIDGSLLVAFERRHRLWRYRSASENGPGAFGAAAEPVPPPAGLNDLPRNGGVEAVTVLGPERILLLSESGEDPAGDLRGWIGGPEGSEDRGWATLGLSPTDGFKPTGLAVLPNGDVLLLERRFTVIGGPAARLSILSAAEIRPGARLAGREIARLMLPLTVDNFEALAVRPAPDGDGTLVYLLSDDNGSLLQRTLLLQFRLRP